MNDRIKLAEAMGWGIGCDTCDDQCIGVPPGDDRPYGQGNLTTMPDPFTDANDDYAVLEWMLVRTPDSSHGRIYLGNKWDYKIGDYARGCLKVLNND